MLDKFRIDETIPEINSTLGEELLKVHKSYLGLIKVLKKKIKVKGFSHITGGGIIGNTKRILPKGLKLKISWDNWEVPEIFKLIKKTGNISDEEMRKVFNLGIGLITIVKKDQRKAIEKVANKFDEESILVGEVV